MNQVTIQVPATSANLGPGFDTFGCAWNLYAKITLTLLPENVLEITGCDAAFCGKDNLVYQAYCHTLEKMGVSAQQGLHIHIDSQIPVCRGLGSSAALLAAGALGANALFGSPFSIAQILAVTNELEGHPDNLAPALYGGLAASLTEMGVPITRKFPVAMGWKFLTLVPDFTLSTTLARSVLPQQVSRADSIFNTAHGVMVLRALADGDAELLKIAMQDKIHQNYRKSLIPDYDTIQQMVEEAGGVFAMSGAGPTLLAVSKSDALQKALEEKLPQNTQAHWRILPLQIDDEGAKICL